MKTKAIMGIVLASFLMTVLSTPVMAKSEQAIVNGELLEVRKHILKEKRYQHVENALADDYVPVSPHIPQMGVHYLNEDLMLEPGVDELSPEILLYVDTLEGAELIAVEYMETALVATPEGPAPWFDESPPPFDWFTTNPVLFGRPMDGPMPGHEPGTPWHYDLHVWLFEENPAGIFEPFNPNIP